MCGRFALYYDREQLVRIAGSSGWLLEKEQEKRYCYRPRYNVAPQQTVPLVRLVAGKRVLQPMRWAISIPGGYGVKNRTALTVINVRAETAFDKVTFRRALEAGHRAVVVANGFYEWTSADPAVQKGSAKVKLSSKTVRVPYFIFSRKSLDAEHASCVSADAGEPGTTPLFMAAMFVEDTDMNRFAIFTVSASPDLLWMHDRMPAILDTVEKLETWLDVDRVSARDAAERCLRPTDQVAWHAVSRAVSSVKNDDPSLVQLRPIESVDKSSVDIRQSFASVLKRSPSDQTIERLCTQKTRSA
ncbi:hypothetical protein CCYA_CCYA03G1099 [Cyanidiococcus yangmingshanensis]|nr:hypothetical protein CCYA_CCYA03G1099 [Cyanidiococcus yangmingshanensis]